MGAALRLPIDDHGDSPRLAVETQPMTAEEAAALVEQIRRAKAQRRCPPPADRPITEEELRLRFEAKRLEQLGLEPTADPEHLRARGLAGETAAVSVRSAYPVGDATLITCEDLHDPTRVYEFGSPGQIARGEKGTVRYLDHVMSRGRGWVFESFERG